MVRLTEFAPLNLLSADDEIYCADVSASQDPERKTTVEGLANSLLQAVSSDASILDDDILIYRDTSAGETFNLTVAQFLDHAFNTLGLRLDSENIISLTDEVVFIEGSGSESGQAKRITFRRFLDNALINTPVSTSLANDDTFLVRDVSQNNGDDRARNITMDNLRGTLVSDATPFTGTINSGDQVLMADVSDTSTNNVVRTTVGDLQLGGSLKIITVGSTPGSDYATLSEAILANRNVTNLQVSLRSDIDAAPSGNLIIDFSGSSLTIFLNNRVLNWNSVSPIALGSSANLHIANGTINITGSSAGGVIEPIGLAHNIFLERIDFNASSSSVSRAIVGLSSLQSVGTSVPLTNVYANDIRWIGQLSGTGTISLIGPVVNQPPDWENQTSLHVKSVFFNVQENTGQWKNRNNGADGVVIPSGPWIDIPLRTDWTSSTTPRYKVANGVCYLQIGTLIRHQEKLKMNYSHYLKVLDRVGQ